MDATIIMRTHEEALAAAWARDPTQVKCEDCHHLFHDGANKRYLLPTMLSCRMKQRTPEERATYMGVKWPKKCAEFIQRAPDAPPPYVEKSQPPVPQYSSDLKYPGKPPAVQSPRQSAARDDLFSRPNATHAVFDLEAPAAAPAVAAAPRSPVAPAPEPTREDSRDPFDLEALA